MSILDKEEVKALRLSIVEPFSLVYGTEIDNTPGEYGEEDSSDVSCSECCYVVVTDVAGKTGYVGVSVAVMVDGDIEHEGQLFSDRDSALAFIRERLKEIAKDTEACIAEDVAAAARKAGQQ